MVDTMMKCLFKWTNTVGQVDEMWEEGNDIKWRSATSVEWCVCEICLK